MPTVGVTHAVSDSGSFSPCSCSSFSIFLQQSQTQIIDNCTVNLTWRLRWNRVAKNLPKVRQFPRANGGGTFELPRIDNFVFQQSFDCCSKVRRWYNRWCCIRQANRKWSKPFKTMNPTEIVNLMVVQHLFDNTLVFCTSWLEIHKFKLEAN